MLTVDQLQAFMADSESDRVEKTRFAFESLHLLATIRRKR